MGWVGPGKNVRGLGWVQRLGLGCCPDTAVIADAAVCRPTAAVNANMWL